ncbi:hypothetical protein [Geodermatophilus sp. SYSU D01176]
MAIPTLAQSTPATSCGGALRLTPACPEALRALLDAGGTAAFIGRESGRWGTKSAELAVGNLFGGMRLLARHGIDVDRAALPAKNALVEQLRAEGRIIRSVEAGSGRPFENLVLVRRYASNLVVHLSVGTGRKIDETLLQQPLAKDIADNAILAHNAVLLACQEATRLGRGDFVASPIDAALQAQAKRRHFVPWIFLGDRPPHAYGPDVRDELLRAGRGGEQESEHFGVRGINGRYENTGEEFVNGRVAYAFEHPVPPGTDIAVLRRLGGRRRIRICYLDEPGSRPTAAEVLSGPVADVALGHGELVDRVELLCWFFAHFGLPEWGYEACADYLLAHGWNTQAARQRGKAGRYARRTPDGLSLARNVCRPILDHLEDFIHERISVPAGLEPVATLAPRDGLGSVDLTAADDPSSPAEDPGGETRTAPMPAAAGASHLYIAGFRPARGHWLTAADATRIKKVLHEGRTRNRNRGRYTFAGLRVRTPAGLGRLKPRCRDGDVVYSIELRAEGRRRYPYVRVPHRALVASVVTALVDHADRLARWLAERDTEEEARHNAELDGLAKELTEKRAALARYEGKWIQLDGPALLSAKQEYNALSAQCVHLQERRDRLERPAHLVDGTHARGVAVDVLLDLLVDLRDPHSVRYRAPLLDALELTVTPERGPHRGRGWERRLRWQGVFLLHDAEGTCQIPLAGATTPPLTPGVAELLLSMVEQLRAGVPFPSTSRQWLPDLRAALGITDGIFRLSAVTDPRLLRLAMDICHPPMPSGTRNRRDADPTEVPRLAGPPMRPGQLPALARRLGEPLALLRRIHSLYVAAPTLGYPRWLHRPAPRLAAVFTAASPRTGIVRRADVPAEVWLGAQLALAGAARRFAADWELHSDRMVLRACGHCGSRRRVPLLLPEADGAVCLHCRHDRADVPWPARYDRYRDR